ncbi:vitamin B12 dependent-methionine synthase activation domain-containing protein [uncultured Clostridium sp.]|uniref:vitamin B12 dependent-methionine synthase activation domain-containing protein n=1 Tax=uncultured Clostridium sp. TaxID=59620 RepID=UPI0028EF9B3F|nr:vitamin B12 dependent-methionine synthase activation domain-containing protein [uncultured Clostridium sp.]
MIQYKFIGDEGEILRYLGVKDNKEEEIKKELYKIKEELKEIVRFRFIYDIFDIEIKEEGVLLKDYNIILRGEDIQSHLKESNKCIIMGATLGGEVDKKINYYQKIDMFKALIMNAGATAFIEEGCDFVEKLIRKEYCSSNEDITWRYSPGYGDLSLNIQGELLKLLQKDKNIGLYLSESSMLIPKKSVTAIIGIISKEKRTNKRSCENCLSKNNCTYRKIGGSCEN